MLSIYCAYIVQNESDHRSKTTRNSMNCRASTHLSAIEGVVSGRRKFLRPTFCSSQIAAQRPDGYFLDLRVVCHKTSLHHGRKCMTLGIHQDDSCYTDIASSNPSVPSHCSVILSPTNKMSRRSSLWVVPLSLSSFSRSSICLSASSFAVCSSLA